MSWVAAGVASAAATAKIIQEVNKKKAAKKLAREQQKQLANLKESNYVPPALQEAEAIAQKNANATRYAGQDVDEANLRQGAATAFTNVQKGSTSSANLVNAAMGIQANQNRSMQLVGQRLQQNKNKWSGNWTNVLYRKSGVQQHNRNQYLAAKSALEGAIMKNKMIVSNAASNAVVAGLGGSGDIASALYYGGAFEGQPKNQPNSQLDGIYDYNNPPNTRLS